MVFICVNFEVSRSLRCWEIKDGWSEVSRSLEMSKILGRLVACGREACAKLTWHISLHEQCYVHVCCNLPNLKVGSFWRKRLGTDTFLSLNLASSAWRSLLLPTFCCMYTLCYPMTDVILHMTPSQSHNILG